MFINSLKGSEFVALQRNNDKDWYGRKYEKDIKLSLSALRTSYSVVGGFSAGSGLEEKGGKPLIASDKLAD